MSEVLVYSRSGCHLCEAARAALDAAGIAYEVVDITSDPALEAEFRLVIPVVGVGGREIFEAGMDPATLPGLVAQELRRPGAGPPHHQEPGA